MSAVLAPWDEAGRIDWEAFAAHVQRTYEAGLLPAVNTDCGCMALVDEAVRGDLLRRTADVLSGREFVAGAFVADRPGDAFPLKAYLRQIEAIAACGGVPIVLQSYGLAHQDSEHIVNDYEAIAACCDRFLVQEAGEQFTPFGRIYSMDVFEAVIGIPECGGAMHASLRRGPLWQRVKLRDRLRPDFMLLSGNDRASDMLTYGCDYLSAVSTMAPDGFAIRDRLWQAGDARFYELNDLLQYLACFTLRDPFPAYRHSAAQFLHLRGWLKSDQTYPDTPRRPESDVEILRDALIWLETIIDEVNETSQ
jgi:dihydrodipicolinate synthase/N-acetylneuraminate lyase